MRRAEDHHRARPGRGTAGPGLADMSAVRRRTVGIGGGEIEAGRLGQQPVQPDDFQARRVGLSPHFGPLRGRDSRASVAMVNGAISMPV